MNKQQFDSQKVSHEKYYIDPEAQVVKKAYVVIRLMLSLSSHLLKNARDSTFKEIRY